MQNWTFYLNKVFFLQKNKKQKELDNIIKTSKWGKVSTSPDSILNEPMYEKLHVFFPHGTFKCYAFVEIKNNVQRQ